MKEQFTQTPETVNFSKFKEYYPDGDISEISLDEVPEKAMEYFERKSSLLILPENYRQRNFSNSYIVNHLDGSKTYLAEQTKNYDEKNETELLTYFVDMNNEEKVGHSELILNINYPKEYKMYYKDKPYVGFTKTEEVARRSGLGTRRIFLMNAYTQMKYGLPLYSDILITESAKKMWEKLVQQGKAKKFNEGGHDRYVLEEDKD